MKIFIESGQRTIRIALPNALLMNKPMIYLGLGIANQYVPKDIGMIAPDKAYAFCTEVRRFVQENGSWTLVDVVSSDGDKVKITL